MANFILPSSISCLLSLDQETGSWIGKCLDFGLVTSGATEEQAWSNMKSVVKMHVEHCCRNSQEAVCSIPAAPAEMRRFEELWKNHEGWSDRIVLNLVAAKARESDVKFWIRAIESAGEQASACVSAVH